MHHRMRGSPEHNEVRLPLIAKLVQAGWAREQLLWKPEWRVPKTPSDAFRREKNEKFEGYPTDLVIFDRAENRRDPDHVLAIFETKKPDERAGISQLKVYLNLEPSARVGIWTNGSRTSRVYRAADGSFVVEHNAALPVPGESFLSSGTAPLKWADLERPTEKRLKDTFRRVLDLVVARDTKATRRDDQLNQLCNLLLVKLESDKLGKADPHKQVVFQFLNSEAETAERIRTYFSTLRSTHADLFGQDESHEISLDDHTISVVAYELGSLQLFDTPLDVMSYAFQVFRTASTKSEEGQYYTPYAVIRSVVALMQLHPSDVVIDPACGTGGFLIEAFRSVQKRFPSMSEGDVKQWAQRHLFGVDKDRINVKLTKAMMLIAGDGSTHTFRADSLRTHVWRSDYPQVHATVHDGTFTVVLTNPPFGEKLTYPPSEARKGRYTIARRNPNSDPNKDWDEGDDQILEREIGIIFLERAHSLLRAGGRLGIILPETYFFSKSYVWLQEWLYARFKIRGIVNIPMEAFQGFCRAKTNFYIMEKL